MKPIRALSLAPNKLERPNLAWIVAFAGPLGAPLALQTTTKLERKRTMKSTDKLLHNVTP
jgi:hypothetical protein